MKKLLSIILMLVTLVSLVSCQRPDAQNPDATSDPTAQDINTNVTTPAVTVFDENLPNADGILRVDGVVLTQAKRHMLNGEARPLNKVFRANCNLGNTFFADLVIEDYDTLIENFSKYITEENVDADSVFDKNLFEKNIVILTRIAESSGYDATPLCWFDCKFVERDSTLTVTPIYKQFCSGGFEYSRDIYFITVPRSFFPENYDFRTLDCIVNDSIKFQDSSMPDPWTAGGKITVAISIKCKDDEYYDSVWRKYADDQLNVDFDKVHEEMRNKNIEYAKKINLQCPDVFYSGASNYIYVNFANKSEFLVYKDYFDSLADSEYVERVFIT